jgi:hypothetical protein
MRQFSYDTIRLWYTGLIFALNDHHTVFIKEVLSSRDICFSLGSQ